MNDDVAIDLYCGLGGWAEGFLAEDYEVIGFDIERHDYGTGGYPGQLVLQDVLTIHGSQFKPLGDRLACIVASPPCQKYSYMAMPWTKAKEMAAWYRESPERIRELNALFNACFRIQREASEALGRHIPLIVENVKGAQPWVGRAGWHFGSFYLWGDIPALMPIPKAKKNQGGSWFNVAHNTLSGVGQNPDGRNISGYGLKTQDHLNIRDGHSHTRHLTNPVKHVKGFDGVASGRGNLGKNQFGRLAWSTSPKRKAASAMIAKIPFPLARHIAASFKTAKVLEFKP